MPNMDQSGMNQGRGNRGGGGKDGGGKRSRGAQAESQTDLYGPIGSNLSDVFSSTDKNSTTSRKENQSQ
jgi:ribosomal protein L15